MVYGGGSRGSSRSSRSSSRRGLLAAVILLLRCHGSLDTTSCELDDDGSCLPPIFAEPVLEDVCVRGVEIAPRGAKQTVLANLTRCTVVSLLALSPKKEGSLARLPLDESAVSAVLRAEALVVHGIEDAGKVASLYGRLLRGSASVVVESGVADEHELEAHFTLRASRDGFSWWSRRTPGGAAALHLAIESPRDGEVFAFESSSKSATIGVRLRLPPPDLLELLPQPRLRLSADPDAARPLEVSLPFAEGKKHDSIVAERTGERTIELTLSSVPPGSHLITASLGLGKGSRVIHECSTNTMIDVVPSELISGQAALPSTVRSSSDVSLGCARANAPSSTSPTVLAVTGKRRLRVALVDVLPSTSVDGQRRVWLQRCAHWARSTEHRAELELSYLLLYDEAVPAVRPDAPLRRAIEAAGVKARAVAAPWHDNRHARGGASGASLQAALSCSHNDDDMVLTGAARAWLKFLNQSVDVLLTHAAPGGIGGSIGDAARLGCLGRLAARAGVGARLVELPTVGSADVLGPRYLKKQRWADAIIVPSHYAAKTTRLAMSIPSKEYEMPVVVLQPGVDDSWFRAGARAAVRRLTSASGKPKIAVWVGRLDADKSPLLFVRACALLVKNHSSPECLIVGEGPLQAALASRVAAMAPVSSNNTRFIGYRGDHEGLADVVASADVLVSTSVFPETFGLAPLEAAAAGVAVVAFGVAGMTEHLCDGVNALVPVAPTPAALAETISALFDDAPKARRLGANGAKAAATHFGSAASADRAALLIHRTFAAMTDFRRRCGNNLTNMTCASPPLLSPVYDDFSFLADIVVPPPRTTPSLP